MTDYRSKLERLAAGPRWKRVLFTLGVNGLLAFKHLRDFYLYLNFHFPRRRFFPHLQPRAHYIGYPANHPHRFAFLVLAVLLGLGSFSVPGAVGVVYWALGWGGVFSIWVFAQTARIIARRIRR